MQLGTIVVLGLVGVVLFGTKAGAAMTDPLTRGSRLSVCTVANGVVTNSDAGLLAQASEVVGRDVDADAYALARMCRSEEGAANQTTKIALCHVVFHQADALGMSPAGLVKFHGSHGSHFGAQIGGRVASIQDPYEDDLVAAETALDQRQSGEDPTAGATNFVDVDAFGVQEGTGSFEAWDEEMHAEGKVGGTLPDTSHGVVFYWRGSVPDIAEALS